MINTAIWVEQHSKYVHTVRLGTFNVLSVLSLAEQSKLLSPLLSKLEADESKSTLTAVMSGQLVPGKLSALHHSVQNHGDIDPKE